MPPAGVKNSSLMYLRKQMSQACNHILFIPADEVVTCTSAVKMHGTMGTISPTGHINFI